MLCGRQCIALRGDVEKITGPGNPGNFLAILRLIANHNQDLREHLESPAMKNATMVSPRIQNELLEVMSQHYIIANLVKEVNDAKFFSVMADEVTSANQEVLAVCIRFADKNDDIREEFISFTKVERITGEILANEIKAVLQGKGLQLSQLRGQGYDGAANMSSNIAGVQGRMKQDAPLAVYIHCNSHALNLVISKSCSLQSIKLAVDKVKAVCLFFQNSPKRNGLLEFIYQANNDASNRNKALIDLCRTRWSARHNAYTHMYQSFEYIIQALEIISNGLHLDKYEKVRTTYADWDYKSKKDASGLLHGLADFNFICTFVIVYLVLSHLEGITIRLQSTTLDILRAFEIVR